MMEGVLVDVDNGYIYTGVQSEGVGKLVRPTFLIEERDSVKRAKTVAVSNFGDELVRRNASTGGQHAARDERCASDSSQSVIPWREACVDSRYLVAGGWGGLLNSPDTLERESPNDPPRSR